jgi:hypothetical protein
MTILKTVMAKVITRQVSAGTAKTFQNQPSVPVRVFVSFCMFQKYIYFKNHQINFFFNVFQ